MKYLYNICAENARLKVSEANRRSRLSQSKRLLRKYSYSEFDFLGGRGEMVFFRCVAVPVQCGRGLTLQSIEKGACLLREKSVTKYCPYLAIVMISY